MPRTRLHREHFVSVLTVNQYFLTGAYSQSQTSVAREDIIAGDTVVVEMEVELLQEFQRGHGEYKEIMENVCISLSGCMF